MIYLLVRRMGACERSCQDFGSDSCSIVAWRAGFPRSMGDVPEIQSQRFSVCGFSVCGWTVITFE